LPAPNHNSTERVIPFPAVVQEGLTKAKKNDMPGAPGFFFLIMGELVIFYSFFLAFTLERIKHPEVYAAGQAALNPYTGLGLTLVLLASSWFVVRAVEATRAGKIEQIKKNLHVALALGIMFAVAKAVGFFTEIAAGHHIMADSFWGGYWMTTGMHFIHVLVGIGVMICCLYRLKNIKADPTYFTFIQTSGIYWHMVDLLWVVIFPMFFLLGGTS